MTGFAPVLLRSGCLQIVCAVAAILLSPPGAAAQLDLDTYRAFLADNADLTAGQLIGQYGNDVFQSEAPTEFAAAAHADSIDAYYHLTDYEKQLIDRRGFAVSERLRPASFGSAYLDIYHQDLPLFVASDAILHALHMSYDAILKELESDLLQYQLEGALQQMQDALPALAARYANEPELAPMLRDVDLYLTVLGCCWGGGTVR